MDAKNCRNLFLVFNSVDSMRRCWLNQKNIAFMTFKALRVDIEGSSSLFDIDNLEFRMPMIDGIRRLLR